MLLRKFPREEEEGEAEPEALRWGERKNPKNEKYLVTHSGQGGGGRLKREPKKPSKKTSDREINHRRTSRAIGLKPVHTCSHLFTQAQRE